jgi:hypothetical protein
VQTPRFCGQACIAGTLFRAVCGDRGLRISWLIVGIRYEPRQTTTPRDTTPYRRR